MTKTQKQLMEIAKNIFKVNKPEHKLWDIKLLRKVKCFFHELIVIVSICFMLAFVGSGSEVPISLINNKNYLYGHYASYAITGLFGYLLIKCLFEPIGRKK